MWQMEGMNDDVPDLDDVLDAVGPRLRALRQQRGATLAQLSESTGISVSTLSRLESGQRKPTLELLLPLARAHQVPLDELVDAPPTGDPRVHLRPFERHGITIIPLTRRPGGAAGVQADHPAAATRTREPNQQVHEGYEWLYVLSGRLRLLLGEHDVILTAGRGRGVRHPRPALVRQPRPAARGDPQPVRPPGRAAARPHGPAGNGSRARPSVEFVRTGDERSLRGAGRDGEAPCDAGFSVFP